MTTALVALAIWCFCLMALAVVQFIILRQVIKALSKLMAQHALLLEELKTYVWPRAQGSDDEVYRRFAAGIAALSDMAKKLIDDPTA